MHFKIDWASLIVESKFTVLALFYFVFEVNFPSTSPQGAYIWRADLTEGFLRYQFGGLILILEGLILGGAYLRNFTVFFCLSFASNFLGKGQISSKSSRYMKTLTFFVNETLLGLIRISKTRYQ